MHAAKPTARIHGWHIVISGFLQHRGKANGMSRLWRTLHAKHAAPDTVVELHAWNDNWDALAEFMGRSSTIAPRIKIYAYSWGGASALKLARALLLRKVSVGYMVLSDPVYRHWYALGQCRSFWPWSVLRLPMKVGNVFTFRQKINWPRGHAVVKTDHNTHVWPPVEIKLSHQAMDDSKAFQIECERVAGL